MSNIIPSSDRIFYHGSMDRLDEGVVLRPDPGYERNWGGTDFYWVLERYRPEHLLPHAKAVFLCDNPDDVDMAGGGTEWMFMVQPLGPIQKHDLNWSSEISGTVDNGADEATLKDIANNYWRGVPHPDESVWEYLTPHAEILKVHPFDELFLFELERSPKPLIP